MMPLLLRITFVLFLCLTAKADLRSESNSLGMEMVLLEGGRYYRGTDGGARAIEQAFPLSVSTQFFGNPEAPRHVTWITNPFWISKTEVTVGQWKAFVADTGHVSDAEKSGLGIVGWSPSPESEPLYESHDFQRTKEFSWKNPGFPQEDSHPVVGVSWGDVRAFLQWLGEKEGGTYRLPTEAEWEFACRAGGQTWFSFGDDPEQQAHQHANLADTTLEKHRPNSAERQWLRPWDEAEGDGYVFTAPVGSYEPNAFGLHDMHGNVWEWCEDLWLDTFYKRFDWPERGQPRVAAVDPINQSEPQTDTNRFRTIRGGSWYNGPVICRSSNRAGWDEPDAAAYIGFRVVRDGGEALPAPVREQYQRETEARNRLAQAGGEFTSTDGLSLALKLGKESFRRELLGDLSLLPELSRLVLEPADVVTLTDHDLELLASIPALEELEFRGSFDLGNATLSILAEAPRLHALRFSRSTRITDAELAHLSSFTGLKEFVCYGPGGGITDAGVAHLAGNTEIERLVFYEVDANGSSLARFAGATLIELAFTGRSETGGALTDEGAKALRSFSGLQKLALNTQGLITDQTLLNLASLEKLEEINLHGCIGIPADGFSTLGELTRLRSLNLQATAAGDQAVAALASIPRIESLRIGSSNLSDAGFADLAGLFSLESLYVETSAATDSGVRHLGRINRLKRLDLGVPAMTGAGLGPVMDLPDLFDLKLRSPALTDVVFEHAARGRSLRKLGFVERGWQPPASISDEGILALAAAPWLTEVWLPRNDTNVTEAGIAKLDAAMPKTSVIPYTVEWNRPEEGNP